MTIAACPLSATSTSIKLDQGWVVANDQHRVPLSVPGDVHSALLAAGKITDPYWRDTETSLDWVHQSEWIANTYFALHELPAGMWTLSFDSIDCVAEVSLNGHLLGRCDNQFIRWDFDVGCRLQKGNNELQVKFLSNTAEALRRASESAWPVPYIEWNNRLAYFNFLRKTQCHAGWDWNIALSPLGLYGDIRLQCVDIARIEDILIRQDHADGRVTVHTTLYHKALSPGEVPVQLHCDGRTVSQILKVFPGKGSLTLSIDIEDPQLWWPVGYGTQSLYELGICFGDERRQMRIGLRSIELLNDADEVGRRFALCINGREIFMRGANWIPADALPGKGSPELVEDLLQSALEANMNMLRVWGGGQYEADWFYEKCSEKGLLIWQDFMFSCNLYPAADPVWLQSVRTEARQQIRRLSRHASLALWCGDNEVIGALGWFEEARNDRDRYLAMYSRLNHALEEAMQQEAIDIPFWSSSPSVGPLNFGDGWHDDTAGDMHFWDVWHSAKDFEHYRTVKPRFCSEFGFQSFPSNQLIATFTEERDRNVSSPVMDVHQRNRGGNSRIVETLARYFRFPEKFEDMTWLSQVSQALAMKTAVEFWRTCKPRCMGTLYWQLNDTWPVVSWASLEYGGSWKLTQYFARRFLAPVLVSAQPAADGGGIVLHAINDSAESLTLKVTAHAVAMSGEMNVLGEWTVSCPTDTAIEVVQLARDQLAEDQILYLQWRDSKGGNEGHNDYLPRRPKDYDLPEATITAIRCEGVDGPEVELISDTLALYVTYDHGGRDIWSDNGFTLLPGIPRVLYRLRDRDGDEPVSGGVAVRCLRG